MNADKPQYNRIYSKLLKFRKCSLDSSSPVTQTIFPYRRSRLQSGFTDFLFLPGLILSIICSKAQRFLQYLAEYAKPHYNAVCLNYYEVKFSIFS